jgi:phosphoribosylformimino-5-aminoimidazole carboxamide ribotide isomerase
MTTSSDGRSVRPPLLPVVDILDGSVVRGIAGQRQSYRPLDSLLVRGAHPGAVARALRNLVAHDWLYLADLNAIEHDAPDWQTLEELAADGCRLLVDAGLRDADRASRLIHAGAEVVVAALETLPDPKVLGEVASAVGQQRTIFSLDLRRGELAGSVQEWRGTDPLVVAERAIATGIGGMIVLDVAGVGVENGVSTSQLCRRLRTNHPDLPLITGGGVRNREDVQQLLADGVDSVLVASALHRGHIGPDDIAQLRS